MELAATHWSGLENCIDIDEAEKTSAPKKNCIQVLQRLFLVILQKSHDLGPRFHSANPPSHALATPLRF